MRRSQHSDEEILVLLDEARRGIDVDEICRTAHVSVRTFYRWRKRLEGVTPDRVGRVNELEAEVRRLRRQLNVAPPPHLPMSARAHGPMRSEIGGPDLATLRSEGTAQRIGAQCGRFRGIR